MTGPTRQEIQLTPESIPGLLSNLVQESTALAKINISWNPPTILNGIITVYEIRYRESTSTGPYNITNTTNTQYSIVGLIPNTSYTIGVRAYTSIGPGEWTDTDYATAEIPIIQIFSVTKFISTAVLAEWGPIIGVSHYTVYYESSNASRITGQVDAGMRVFPGDITEGLIGGLDPNLNYMFSISTSFNFNGNIYEGQRSNPILWQPSVQYPNVTTDAVTSTVVSTVTTVLLNDGEEIGLIVGVSVVYIPILVLAILVIVLYMKRANNFNKRKPDNDIVMKCSPAYATTEFKTKSNIELVYETPESKTPNPQAPPPPTEYEVVTV